MSPGGRGGGGPAVEGSLDQNILKYYVQESRHLRGSLLEMPEADRRLILSDIDKWRQSTAFNDGDSQPEFSEGAKAVIGRERGLESLLNRQGRYIALDPAWLCKQQTSHLHEEIVGQTGLQGFLESQVEYIDVAPGASLVAILDALREKSDTISVGVREAILKNGSKAVDELFKPEAKATFQRTGVELDSNADGGYRGGDYVQITPATPGGLLAPERAEPLYKSLLKASGYHQSNTAFKELVRLACDEVRPRFVEMEVRRQRTAGLMKEIDDRLKQLREQRPVISKVAGRYRYQTVADVSHPQHPVFERHIWDLSQAKQRLTSYISTGVPQRCVFISREAKTGVGLWSRLRAFFNCSPKVAKTESILVKASTSPFFTQSTATRRKRTPAATPPATG